MGNLGFKIVHGSFGTDKRGSSLNQQVLAFVHIEFDIGTDTTGIAYSLTSREYGIASEYAEACYLLLETNHKMSAISGGLSPALIDTMDGIVTADDVVHRIDRDKSLPFIAVRIDNQIGFTAFLIGETENGRARTCRHLCCQSLIGQGNGIIGRSGLLGLVRETGYTCFGHAPQTAKKRHQGHGTVILCAPANNPMRIAETLQKAVGIIVRSNAFLFGVASLRSPEIHSVGFEYCGQRLSVFLGILSKQSRRMRHTGSRTNPRINIWQTFFLRTFLRTSCTKACNGKNTQDTI